MKVDKVIIVFVAVFVTGVMVVSVSQDSLLPPPPIPFGILKPDCN